MKLVRQFDHSHKSMLFFCRHHVLLLLGLNDEVSQLVRALASVHTRIDVH
jgi:hypothetical protein